jgi:hypothetical protein
MVWSNYEALVCHRLPRFTSRKTWSKFFQERSPGIRASQESKNSITIQFLVISALPDTIIVRGLGKKPSMSTGVLQLDAIVVISEWLAC